MPNPNKARGTRWETALVRFFTERTGLPLRRVAQQGILDQGDLHGIPDFTIQAKDWERWGRADAERWLDDVTRQADAADLIYGAVAIKRRGKSVRDCIVIVRGDVFAEMIRLIYGSSILSD